MGILDAIFSAAFEGETPPTVPTWVEWEHVARGITHCPVCLKLDGCWFTDETKPMLPQHPRCHCQANPLSFSRVLSEAKATSKYSKFDPYLFDPENAYKHGKQKMFESWGYSVDDSQWLQKEFERQALDKYVSGEYQLGVLDKFGQRIHIRIEIPRKNSTEKVSFYTGWMVHPGGQIKLNTPYGGK